MNYINEMVRKYRRKAKISQHKMAELLGMEYRQYARMERDGNIRAQILLEIAHYLNTEPQKLVISGLMAEYEELQSPKNY